MGLFTATGLSRRDFLWLSGVGVLGGITGALAQSKDPLYDQAIEIARAIQQVPSVSLLQRRLKIGYRRAGNLVADIQKEMVWTAS